MRSRAEHCPNFGSPDRDVPGTREPPQRWGYRHAEPIEARPRKEGGILFGMVFTRAWYRGGSMRGGGTGHEPLRCLPGAAIIHTHNRVNQQGTLDSAPPFQPAFRAAIRCPPNCINRGIVRVSFTWRLFAVFGSAGIRNDKLSHGKLPKLSRIALRHFFNPGILPHNQSAT